MAAKKRASICRIREQIIDDEVTGLTLQFEFRPNSRTPVRLRIFGAPVGSREILFDADGNEVEAVTAADTRASDSRGKFRA